MAESKLDNAWDKLFEKYDITNEVESKGKFIISANQIKEFREPRLMTKFDWKSARPKKFISHKLSILPDSRGEYVIGKFRAYQELNYKEIRPISVKMTDWVRSFDDFTVSSEAVALNIAQMTGMIDMVLGNVSTPAVSTITGRLKSGQINYDISMMGSQKPYHFSVNNSQVEIDAGFETLNELVVIEAKNRIPNDFIIRQLYYPYRLFENLATGKRVIPIFFTYSDGIYAFHVYKFNELNNYSSIEKVKQVNFIVDKTLDINLDDIKRISKESADVTPQEVSFPQADTFTRVLDLLDVLRTPKNKHQIAEIYSFDERQSDYYGNALRYLGFAKKDSVNHVFELTRLGRKVARMPNSNDRNLIIIQNMLSSKAINLIFKDFLINQEFRNEFIDDVIRKYGGVGGKSTLHRRNFTAKNWITWILDTATLE
ncbi:type II restriction enzyme [Levilactobacillus lanxiensis]|uniref:Type II restriction enzyme n=1 Tax=Levilactobacillus lanxiensis TaxID=2799568 RepID=A0ABW4CZ60_9LACO|nr:hypothetical protein [Levilactobacillus lanxiensis]